MDEDELPVVPPKVEPQRRIRRMRRAGDNDDRNGMMGNAPGKFWATLDPRRGLAMPPVPPPPNNTP